MPPGIRSDICHGSGFQYCWLRQSQSARAGHVTDHLCGLARMAQRVPCRLAPRDDNWPRQPDNEEKNVCTCFKRWSPNDSRTRSLIRGRVIAPGDESYDAARTVFYGGIDKRPAAIIRVADADDAAWLVSLTRTTASSSPSAAAATAPPVTA